MPKPELLCYFDGACEPINPGGTAAYGAVILHAESGKTIKELCGIVNCPKEQSSNNVAEYAGLISVLEELLQRKWHNKETLIRGDSQLVINQMFGDWRIKSGLYVAYANHATELVRCFKNLRGQWVPREQNTIADKLSKDPLLKRGIGIRR